MKRLIVGGCLLGATLIPSVSAFGDPPTGPTGPTGVTTTTSTTTTVPPTPFYTSQHWGSRGPRVVALQQRLAQLGYWVGPITGTYGYLTQQAVYAVEKVNGLPLDGNVRKIVALALQRGVLPTVRSKVGNAVEISLSKQIAMIVHNGRLVRVFNISSGGGYQYTQEGATYTATTPKGSFHVYREVSGWDKGPLGAMWQPKYFYSGYALHGSLDVPPYPASHGCIRFSVDAMTYLWNSNLIPIGTRVMIYQ